MRFLGLWSPGLQKIFEKFVKPSCPQKPLQCNANNAVPFKCHLKICHLSFDMRHFPHFLLDFVADPAGNYMFKVNNRNTRTSCEIVSKLTKK